MTTSAMPALKATDLLPKEILGEPVPDNAYLDAFFGFLLIAAPSILIATGAFIGIVELMKRGAEPWLIIILVVAAFVAILVLLYGFYAYQNQLTSYKNRDLTRQQAVMMCALAIQNLSYQNVEVKGRNNNVTVTTNQTAETTQVLDTTNTQVYQVALHIARKAIASWLKNGGQREKPKPISSAVITAEMGVGGEMWQDAIALVDEAGIMRNAAHATTWRVLVTDPKQAEDALHRTMLKRGYASRWENGEQSWYKINAPTLLNG